MRHSRRQERQTGPKPTALCPHQRSYTLLSVHSFYVILFFFNCRLITLKYCSGFCHTLAQISHRCTCVPQPDPPSHLPPHPIPQGHPSALTLSTLLHASNLDWQSISYMIIYMFQCYSLKSSHPRLFPHSPKNLFFTSVSLLLSCM